jgi:two-component system alkaline phosphatase synthesis response regulator PhoP
LAKASEWKPHLVILDVMMPEMDGIETCEQLRKNPNLSELVIVFLTARSEDYSQVAGLEAGADDYITKPIKPKVLLSKIKAILRRLKGEKSKHYLEVGDLVVNREEYMVIYKGQEISLPRKEFELLFLLASKPHKVFERSEILDKVWGNEVVVGGRTIDVHIRKLREKIGDKHFKTIKGVGYKYVD